MTKAGKKTVRIGRPTAGQVEMLKQIYAHFPVEEGGRGVDSPVPDPRVEQLVFDVIASVADKWTMALLEVLTEHGVMRFSDLSRAVEGISQKMLTQTLRSMERNGLVSRKIYPQVPPRVEYRITDLGLSLSAAFCGVWMWAAHNLQAVEDARRRFRQKA